MDINVDATLNEEKKKQLQKLIEQKGRAESNFSINFQIDKVPFDQWFLTKLTLICALNSCHFGAALSASGVATTAL